MLRKVLYVRWRVPVGNSAGVQRPVVTARSQTSILLWDDVYWRCPGTLRRVHDSLLDQCCKFRLDLLETVRCEPAEFAIYGRAVVVSEVIRCRLILTKTGVYLTT